MIIESLKVGDLDTNCYVVWDEESEEAVIVDPGADGGFISEKILKWKLKPLCIVLTHGHFDHVLGCLEIKLNFQIPILLHKEDERLYKQANKSAKHWAGRAEDPVPKIDRYIKEGEEIIFGKEKLRVIEVPGHTPGSVCLYDERGRNLFSGDTLFRNGVGRTDFSYSNEFDLARSLQKIKRLPLNCTVYPGHGEITTIAEEKQIRDTDQEFL